MAAKPLLDLSLVPGTPAEQRRAAALYHGKPIKIEKSGRRWAVIVLGIPIGFVDKKSDAKSAAHQIGHYRFQMGDFAFSYVEGW